MNVRASRIISALAISLLMVTSLVAQTSTSGSIEGKVSDKAGAALPGVTIDLRSPQLQGARSGAACASMGMGVTSPSLNVDLRSPLNDMSR